MRTEGDLRAALRVLERETPDAQKVLMHVAAPGGTRPTGRGPRPGRRLVAASAVAAAVVAVAVTASLAATSSPRHSRPPAPPADANQPGPHFFMALVPANLKSYEQSGGSEENYAVIRDRINGQTLATVRPPEPYVTFVAVSGAADDRTFVLAAQSTAAGSQTSHVKFFSARFNLADDSLALAPLALTGLPVSDDFTAAALSPDGTRLAVASQNGEPARITVYSLPGGAATTWSAAPGFPFGGSTVDVLSWSSTGMLGFLWSGSVGFVRENGRLVAAKPSPRGEYLLNTNSAGGSLLAHSRDALCLPGKYLPTYPAPYYGYLTPDGTKIIAPVGHPFPVGQAPPACRAPELFPGRPLSAPSRTPSPQLEEFSVATGRALGVIDTSKLGAEGASPVYWSSSAGSVLVVNGKKGVAGIVTGTSFTPIPGSSSRTLVTMAF